jgi:hypothetical protein
MLAQSCFWFRVKTQPFVKLRRILAFFHPNVHCMQCEKAMKWLEPGTAASLTRQGG